MSDISSATSYRTRLVDTDHTSMNNLSLALGCPQHALWAVTGKFTPMSNLPVLFQQEV